jgi:hypothetical protein
VIESILIAGKPWRESDPEKLNDIRRRLAKLDDYHFKSLLRKFANPAICEAETYADLIRTPIMRKRLLALNIIRPKKLSGKSELRNRKDSQRGMTGRSNTSRSGHSRFCRLRSCTAFRMSGSLKSAESCEYQRPHQATGRACAADRSRAARHCQS